jgi:hypothetical protein
MIVAPFREWKGILDYEGVLSMKALALVGVLLLVLGALSFVIPISHKDNHGISIGGAKIAVQTENTEKLPPAVGIILMAGGVLSLILGLRKN